jgi:hypothetical protein
MRKTGGDMRIIFVVVLAISITAPVFPRMADSSSIQETINQDTVMSRKPAAEVVENEKPSTSSGSEYSCQELRGKVASFTKMRNAGIGLLAGGGVGVIVGAAMIASANGVAYYSYDSNTGESGNMTGGIGADIAVLGVALTVAGIVLTSIGAKKSREYSERANAQHCRLEVEISPNAVELVYRF